jgi:alpha-glucosidase (family GH31 glycosyl hydrolase)
MFKKMLMVCGTVMAISFGAFAWTAGSLTVTITNSPMNINVSAGTTTLLEVTGITFGTTNYTTISSVVETTDSVVINLTASLAVTIKPVSSGIRMYGRVAAATTVRVTMRDLNDHFFGITEQNINGNSPDLRTRTINITAANIQNYGNEPQAKAWSAFYMSSLGYGSFFDSFAEGTYVFGSGGVTTITHNTNTIDWYIFYGPTGDKIHQAYFKAIQTIEGLGTRSPTKKVPIWACGMVIWHNNYSGNVQVMSHITNFTSNQIPITAQWIDRPYADGGGPGWGYMNFSAAFSNPTPATWIRQITSDTGYNVKEMTWIAPCTFGDPVPPAGTYFSGGYYYLDLTNPSAVTWYKRKLDSLQHNIGIQGHKMDRCEESMSQVTSGTWYDGTPTTEKQPKYLYLNAKVTDEALRTVWGDNQLSFPRGAYHRTQPYNGAVWAGDTRAPWAGLVGALANGIKTAFCGFPVWGSDIGGYGTGSTKIAKDQYLRWLTFGCFCGFMENMLDGKEPYIYTAAGDTVAGQSFVSRYKEVCDLRMKLLPYIYSLANTSADNGVAMPPLPYMYPGDANTYAIGDEYLFGPAMLVAPIVSATMTRSVYLPAGTWYYFFNYAETHIGGASFTTPTVPLYQIPVYIKANSIVVTGQIYPGNSKRWITNYDNTRYVAINAFPGTASGQTTSFTYVDYLDANSLKAITCTVGPDSDSMVTVTVPAMTVPETLMVRMNSTPVSVVLNSARLTTSQYAYNGTTKRLTVPATQVANILVINGPDVGLREKHEAPSLHGKLQLVPSNHGMTLRIPPITGIAQSSRVSVSIFDISGKCLWQGVNAGDPHSSTVVGLPLNRHGGTYLVVLKVDGAVLQRGKIVVP